MSRVTRRAALSTLAAPAFLQAQSNRTDNPVILENHRPGTFEWQLKHFRFDDSKGAGLRSTQLEGYVSLCSVYPGGKIDFMVSTDPAKKFQIDFYRTGYYAAKGGRHMLRLGPFSGEVQPVPMMGMERVRECAWKPLASLTVPANWTSGVYLAKLSLVDAPIESYMIFIVKQDRPADFLFQCSDLTWNAYNKWPGKDSLYDDGLPHPNNGYYYWGPNIRTSFDRPYTKYAQCNDQTLSLGSGEYLLWEFPLAFWMEQQGYDVTYCSNLDVDSDPAVLDRCKVFLSVAHDEYWTPRMYRNVMEARRRGVSLAFLSGNTMMGDVILTNSTTQNQAARDWVVRKAEHWIFAGTGIRNGDLIPGLVGWEYNGVPANLPGLEIIAAADLAPFSRHKPDDGKHAAVVFPGEKGNWVFNAGTIWWNEGLSNPPGHQPASSSLGRAFGVDERVQKITANFFSRCLHDSRLGR